MSAIEKTQALRRENLPIGDLEPNPDNPNKMSSRQFDLLCDNLQQTGITDPVLVRVLPHNKYRIVGGHHRWEAAKYLGFSEVPCTIIDDPDFGEEEELFQNVRMNVIKGKMDPAAFFNMWSKISTKYTQDVAQEMFGFAEQAEFQKLINQASKSLPTELQKSFKDAAKEIKTIDGLAKLLNEMFTRHGDSLPFGYMVFDYAGQRSVWLQVSKKTVEAFGELGAICRENKRTVDDILGALVQSISQGNLAELVADLVEKSPAVELPPGYTGIPTKQNITTFQEMD